jgi:hypothetical protein
MASNAFEKCSMVCSIVLIVLVWMIIQTYQLWMRGAPCVPVRWWIFHGANGVHLQTLAIRILSQVASSSSTKRNWSTYDSIQ